MKIHPDYVVAGSALTLVGIGLVIGGGEQVWPLPAPEGGAGSTGMLAQIALLPVAALAVMYWVSLMCPRFERWLIQKGFNN